jgi:CheY-like chemotaxis protein
VLEGLRLADQRKTEFLATLAHELRNPLAPLRTALSILTMKEHSAETARPHYEMMGRQINHMVRLIDDLMEVSRITRGKIELKLGIVPLNRVIDEAIELSRPAIDAGKHRLQQTFPEERWFVRGDSVRLTQVFSNLLNNAAKYTPPGGTIEVIAGRHADRVRIHVRDNGVGVPADMLQPMFEMFVQVPDAARTAQGGLGIGLTLVKSLVELHGGSVQARSDGPGRGTDITVELPLVKPAELPSDPIAYEALQGPLAETVLVVDDNRDAADSLSVLLRAFGARTAVAYSGSAALELMKSLHASIAIVDIGMPGMDGCELAQRLRADPRNADLLLVALTGWGQPGDRLRIKSAGFDHHFLKPLDSDSLIGMLRAVRAAPSHAPHARTH